MAEYTDDQLFDMSDEELEAAFKEAQATLNSPDTEIEDTEVNDEIPEDAFDEDVDEDEEIAMEQPEDEQDSDDDASLDEDEEEDSEDESDEDDETLDEETEDSDEDPDDDDDDLDEDEQPVQDEVLTFRANGQDYNFTVDEMKSQFGKVFGQAMDYTKKMQAIKPHRKTIDAIEQAGLTNDDINLMIDVLKGDKDAMADVLKRTGIDTLDLDIENSNYVAKDYGRNDVELDIKDIVEDISRDAEYSTTEAILSKQWDNKSREAFVEDPNMIRLLHTDVKSGMFNTINPIAQKLKVYDGGARSDLDYYKQAAQQYFAHQEAQEQKANEQEARRVAQEEQAQKAEEVARVKANQQKRTATKQASKKRKAAAPTRKAAGSKKVTDYLDESEEAFDDWYNKLMDTH